MSATIKITTRTGGGFTTLEFHNAEHKPEGEFLLVTHDDTKKPGGRLLSRVPLGNIVQILEALPEKTS